MLQCLAIFNALVGLTLIILQIVTDSIYGIEYVVDLINSGVWGGMFILATSYLAFFFKEHLVVQMTTLAMLSTSSSVAVIALYAWHISDYDNCKESCESRLAIAIIFIVAGSAAFFINVFCGLFAASTVAPPYKKLKTTTKSYVPRI